MAYLKVFMTRLTISSSSLLVPLVIIIMYFNRRMCSTIDGFLGLIVRDIYTWILIFSCKIVLKFDRLKIIN